jgi:hypothetical protein
MNEVYVPPGVLILLVPFDMTDPREFLSISLDYPPSSKAEASSPTTASPRVLLISE